MIFFGYSYLILWSIVLKVSVSWFFFFSRIGSMSLDSAIAFVYASEILTNGCPDFSPEEWEPLILQ